MAKDPFSQIPPIQEDAYREQAASTSAREPRYEEEDVTKGAPPRNLIKSISKIAIPVLGVGICIWLLLPNSGPSYKKTDLPEPVVDQTRQLAQTNSLLDDIREKAGKVPPVAAPVPFTALPVQPLAPVPAGESPDVAKMKAELERREQEIRASTLEAGSLRLIDQEAGAGGSLPRSRASDFQSEIAATNQARLEAMKNAENAASKAMASAMPGEPPKTKGANEEFLSEQQDLASANNDVLRQQASVSRTVLNQGAVIRTVLLTGVNSDLPGAVRAQVTSDVYDSTFQRDVLIPKGSQLIGAYSSQVVVGQERLLLAMNRLILPNGTWISLAGAPASDMTGQSGLEADVNNHFMKMFGTSLVLGASSLLLSERKTTVTTTTSGGATTNGGTVLANALNDTLRTLLERNKSIAPTLTVKPGEEFTFLVAKDMAMTPYRR